MLQRYVMGLLALMFSLFAGLARAAVDVTAVTAGISEAETAILSVIGALLTLSVAIFGVAKVYRFVSRKAGG